MFLTLDVDWACDDILSDTIDLVEHAGVAATWFVTHETALLDRLRSNPCFELGIHPNFNPLLDRRQNGDNRSAHDVLAEILRVVPEAKAVRSHSMTQSSQLLELFKRQGLTHDCNHFIPYDSGIALRPWRHWNGLIKVPYSWEDDIHALTVSGTPMQVPMSETGLVVVDFHPIHVFLNTERIDQYESTRALHRDARSLICRRAVSSHGSRALLQNLLDMAQ